MPPYPFQKGSSHMSFSRLCFAAIAIFALFLMVSPVRAEPALSPAQEKAVQEMVRKIIKENPELIIEAIQGLQAKQEAAEQERAMKAMKARRADLEQDANDPVAGDAKGDVTVVEFFDYQCGYCKRVVPMLQETLKEDPKVRIVFKEFPVLGEGSVIAAKAALAAWKTDKDKYFAFHAALMAAKGQFNEDKVLDIAKEAGLDAAKLKKAMEDPAIEAALRKNHILAKELGINGTPGFVIGDNLIPGALPKAALKEAIADARKKK